MQYGALEKDRMHLKWNLKSSNNWTILDTRLNSLRVKHKEILSIKLCVLYLQLLLLFSTNDKMNIILSIHILLLNTQRTKPIKKYRITFANCIQYLNQINSTVDIYIYICDRSWALSSFSIRALIFFYVFFLCLLLVMIMTTGSGITNLEHQPPLPLFISSNIKLN